MRGINKVIVVGNATRDAELHQTTTGKPMANVRLATNRMAGGQEEAQYHTVICFDRLAEVAGQYVTTGKLVYIEGRLQTRKFQDKQGLTREVTEIVASDLQLLGGRPHESGEAGEPEDAGDGEESAA